jgi:rhamnogalacturonan endolyase
MSTTRFHFSRLRRCGVLLVLGAGCFGPIAVAQTDSRPTLHLIGDSTVRNGSGAGADALWGWGSLVAYHFDPERISIINRAIGGRSSRTFLTEGRWDEVMKEIQPGDFVMMQFGHNDGGSLTEDRGRGSLRGNGAETQVITNKAGVVETVHTYGWYLRQYIAGAKVKGATPIVVSPIPRNRWQAGKVVREANGYGGWAKQAAEQGGAAFLDLNELVAARYEQMGEATVREMFFRPDDHTHTTLAGAKLNATLVAEGIRGLSEVGLFKYLLPSGLATESGAAVYELNDAGSTAYVDLSNAGMFYWNLGGSNQINQQWFWYRIGNSRVDRGLVVLPKSDNEVYLGWRLLGADGVGNSFNVYRSTDGGELVRLNPQPLRQSTDFLDQTVSLTKSNFWLVQVVIGTNEATVGTAALAANVAPQSYVAIKLQGDYLFSKVGIADLDGDGKLDFVIKQPHQVSDPGVWRMSEDTYKIEAYRHDGTFLWRRDLGWNIEQGVWWSPMIVADLDGDGKAEVALKTAPLDPIYRNEAGRILAGPEYLSIWDGMTGKDIAQVDWPPRGNIEDWGDKVGNRASRHLIGIAKLVGKRTSVLALRGTYTTMLVDAYNLVNGKLEKVWGWNGDHDSPPVRGQGMHGMHAADVDGDGREEIILGAAVIDDNGKTLWNLGLGHPDVCYVTDVIPERPGLEIAYGFETAQKKNGFCVVDAKTGEIIWGNDFPTTHIHSQGLLADIDPTNPGLELYSGEKALTNRWLFSARDGKLLSLEDLGSLAPNPIYWDDSYVKPYLTRDGDIVKYRGAKLGKIDGRVIAIADILGDWREEIITTVPGELRIYTTAIPASRRNVWLMEDPIYRNNVSHVSMGYLYPPQLTQPLTAETKP